jgi:hypothetical protein
MTDTLAPEERIKGDKQLEGIGAKSEWQLQFFDASRSIQTPTYSKFSPFSLNPVDMDTICSEFLAP